jgi:hypothetical protein
MWRRGDGEAGDYGYFWRLGSVRGRIEMGRYRSIEILDVWHWLYIRMLKVGARG